ncbi:aprataxin and PNK-like factor [Fundulus heteroclitus]|uniref:aprataxin and PNK-like factor n=1 Tax=Fundulus heteroclitus TaxID=8078 RepID=UPI00165BDFAD|nr:aprataxin and PNK-like factor [Fundulus heteroclitus]
MSGFGLAPVDGGDLVPLSPGETVLGRGPLLGISDTRISRHHGLLENLNGQLRLKPTHVNPCFVLSSLKDDPRPLEKGSWHRLHPGDLFSLLPGRFIYRVEAVGREDSTPRNSQNLEEEGELPVSARTTVEAAGPEQEQVSDPNRSEPTGPNTSLAQEVSTRRLDDIQSNEPPPAPRRRVLPAWMMASVAAPKSPATAPKGQSGVRRRKQTAAATISSVPLRAGHREEEEEEEKEEERLTKKRRKMSEEENLPAETEVLTEESSSRVQIKPRRSSQDGVSSHSDLLSVKLEDDGKGEGPAQTSESRKSPKEKKSQSPVRTPCPYGKDCYRKNPLHFQECSHPGDSDYEEEEEEEEEAERPECPYGTDCYRKNPLHRKEFSHTKKPARSAQNAAPEDEDVSGDDDSFINDDSDDLGNDSDYVPPGSDHSEREDVRRLQREAAAFLEKGRR